MGECQDVSIGAMEAEGDLWWEVHGMWVGEVREKRAGGGWEAGERWVGGWWALDRR